MDFSKYRRLKKAALHAETFTTFIGEVASAPHWYGVPLWTRADYEWLYNKIKGGSTYVTLFTNAQAA